MLICLQFQIKDPIVIIRGFRLRKLDIERVLYLDFGNPRLYVIALYASKIYEKGENKGYGTIVVTYGVTYKRIL